MHLSLANRWKFLPALPIGLIAVLTIAVVWLDLQRHVG
jgi:hypothetical protein